MKKGLLGRLPTQRAALGTELLNGTSKEGANVYARKASEKGKSGEAGSGTALAAAGSAVSPTTKDFGQLAEA